ncbi:2-oxoglutarate (2OG) and Fe(II)-dependent oxygenase superfamily protein [Euphorbia peplus]|nr:2-oxoglutarate (2OG) and Fe(II)-dependent oxygenase superfamily protein [Euphorbia peplus]
MGSENIENVPEIDLSDLQPGSPEWEEARTHVWKAVVEYGCFRIVFRNIPVELRNDILSDQKELFELPLETKLLNNEVCEFPFGGYIGKSPFTPLYESIGFDNPFKFDMVEKLINALLPPARPHFCKRIHDYTKQISEVENIIMRMIMESLGIEKYMDEHLNSVFYSLRLQKYDIPEKEDEGEIGLQIHKDQDIMTILYQNEVDGVETETRDGRWISCKTQTHNFTVFIGESLHAWTNGRAYAPYHRVLMKGKKARYSVGLFTAFKEGYVIKAPEELVDEEYPLLYKPFDHFEYLKLVERDAVENYQTTLKPYIPLTAYFGI